VAYDPLTGRYTPDKAPTATPFGQAGGAFKELPTSAGTAFGQAGGNVGTIASTPATAGADYAQQLSESKAEAQKLLKQAKKSGNKDAINMAQMTLDNINQAENLITLLGGTSGTGGGTGAFAGNRSDASYVAEGRTGTSNTGQKYINGKLVSESEFQTYLYGNQKGGGTGAGTSAAASTAAADALAKRQSAFDLLREQFSQYGLEGLVEPLKGLIQENVSPSEFAVRLRQTEPYKKRFAANAARIGKGLRALSEAEYLTLEDSYQNIMRNYGLPASYYAKGDMGRQEGFEKFIGGDVSAAELEDRIQTAQNRVINAAPEIATTLKSFYPDITNGDILAYALDPDKAITEIRRKVTAAEIGGAATMAGLAADRARAEELGRFGVTSEQARQGFRAVAEVAPRGGQLAEFYRQTPYTQATAEQEVFGLTGAAEAGRQRRKLTELEQAAFSGQAGAAGGALARDRAGAF